VNQIEDVAHDDLVAARGDLIGTDGSLQLRNPIRMSRTPAAVRRPAPTLGADGDSWWE
jgi:crotonobetainyl-CoA:carnitine CoA-transferase CaiB-like acyl-CoA transferase